VLTRWHEYDPLDHSRKQEGKGDDKTTAVESYMCLTYNLLFLKRVSNQALRIIPAGATGGINLAQGRSEVRCLRYSRHVGKA
jgi:hypothetical protein